MNGTAAPQGHQKLSAHIRAKLPAYISKQASQVERVAALLESGDFDEIVRIGHTISGTGSGYGLPELGNLASAMEEAAEARDAAAISRCESALSLMLKDLQNSQ